MNGEYEGKQTGKAIITSVALHDEDFKLIAALKLLAEKERAGKHSKSAIVRRAIRAYANLMGIS